MILYFSLKLSPFREGILHNCKCLLTSLKLTFAVMLRVIGVTLTFLSTFRAYISVPGSRVSLGH